VDGRKAEGGEAGRQAAEARGQEGAEEDRSHRTEEAMNLRDAVAQIDAYSRRASENVRSLVLAGLAFVWLLARDLSGVRGDLLVAASLLLLALFADFAHYFIGALRWDLFVRRVEREDETVTSDTPIAVEDDLSRPIYLAYYVKIAITVAAYLSLAFAVLSRIWGPPRG
jgi:hypothetical protein